MWGRTVRHREDEVGQRPAVTLAGSRSCLSEVNTPNDPLPGMRQDLPGHFESMELMTRGHGFHQRLLAAVGRCCGPPSFPRLPRLSPSTAA